MTTSTKEDTAEWKQPENAHEAYRKGDTVRYDGHTWICYYMLNMWAPGEAGWEQLK